MTMEHPPFERLSALVDGDLAPQDAQAIDRHVAACDACHAELSRLRAVLGRAAALPRTIEPPKSAWTVVRARLRIPTARRTRGALWLQQWGLRAAAALALVAGSSALTVLALRGGPFARDEAVLNRAGTPVVPAAVQAVDRSYADVVDELTVAVNAQRQTLNPQTIAILERTLRVIDQAIAEARAALAADPRNDALVDVLSANYEQKVQLLRRASELPARS